jgi:DNA-binding XRE family transcriptional regulator
LRTAAGADDLAGRIRHLLAEERAAIQAALARAIEARLRASYAQAAGEADIDPLAARKNCRTIAAEVLKDAGFFDKLARWVAVNVCFWLWEGDTPDSIDGESVGALIGVYAESTAQVLGELMSPPHKPLAHLEAILGVGRAAPGAAAGDIPPGMLVVLSAAHVQALREALSKNTFRAMDGTPWPTACLDVVGGGGFAQLRPPPGEELAALSPRAAGSWARSMWRQQSELSDRDADLLDALCALYLSQAKSPNDTAVAEVDQLLALRGLKAKRGGGGRRGGYEPEQRREMMRSLTHLQNLWVTILDLPSGEAAPAGRRRGAKRLQSRPFVITDRMGQIGEDGELAVERFVFRPGKAFAAFLFGSARQTGLLFRKALEYDPYRKRWEKRLTRYLSWHWRAEGSAAAAPCAYPLQSLLEVVGEEPDRRYPARCRLRLEKALDTLCADGILAGWHYGALLPSPAGRGDWLAAWLAAAVIIAPPPPVTEYYARLRAEAPAAGDSVGARIRRRRRRLGLTQAELAERFGIRQGHLSKIENGAMEPSARLRAIIEPWLEEDAN